MEETISLNKAYLFSIISLVISGCVLVASLLRVSLLRRQILSNEKQYLKNGKVAREKLDLLNKQLRDQHEWNRREKSIQYSGLYHTRVKDARLLLDEHFKIFTRRDPIPLETLIAKIEDVKSLRSEINYLLTYYENISIAMKMKVADEEIIRLMLRGTFVSYKMKLSNYINRRREQTRNEELWVNFSYYADMWSKENNVDNPSKPITGV